MKKIEITDKALEALEEAMGGAGLDNYSETITGMFDTVLELTHYISEKRDKEKKLLALVESVTAMHVDLTEIQRLQWNSHYLKLYDVVTENLKALEEIK